MRILLVEDDDRVADALGTALRRQGYGVARAATARAALNAPAVDLVLLDLGLPDADGIEVCRQLRRRSDVAIIAVTARGDEPDRVAGLRSGADDYVVKPFGIAELKARIDAVMRRVRPWEQPGLRQVVEVGQVVVDLPNREVTVAGRPVPLTRKEFELLALLAREPGRVVPRERILIEVWHTTWRGTGRTLDVHIATLRAKLGDASIVETVRGVGYRLHVDKPASGATSGPPAPQGDTDDGPASRLQPSPD